MYLNEQSWYVQQEDSYVIDEKIKKFLDVYAWIKRKNPRKEIFVPEGEQLYIKSSSYPLAKWLSNADREYRRLYLSFWNKRITYKVEDEYEVRVDNEILKGGTEAHLNDSFMLSIGLDSKWEQKTINALLCSVCEEEKQISLKNVYCREQLDEIDIQKNFYKKEIEAIKTYEELWKQRDQLFPHLCFCPSIEKDFSVLQISYLDGIIKKLLELEEYCVNFAGKIFDPSKLTKTTLESESTLNQYKKEHTFIDEKGIEYLASWHMRFTGIPGRIFFIPQYEQDKILICYIGKKLKNVSYPT